MLRRNSALLLWLLIGIGGAVAMAEPNGVYLGLCLPSELDVTALPPSILLSHPLGHLLVLELQNIGSTECTLDYPVIELLPFSDDSVSNRGFTILATSNAEEPLEALGTKPLAPGEWAHFVVVWVDRTFSQMPCEEYSTLRLNFYAAHGFPTPDDEAVEVRNLWIHSCPPAFVSPYRVGHFHGDINLSKRWKKMREPTEIDLSFPQQILSSEIVQSSPLFRVHTQAARTMMGDNIQLRINFSRHLDNGCAYRMLRRRESNGATLIQMQNCPQDDAWTPQPVSGPEDSRITRLELRFRNLLPDHLGNVEYDFLGQIGQAKTPVLARASASFSVRDPTNPSEATLMTDLASCTASQLQFTALPLSVPKRLINVRAYEARNVSAKACSVAGVPNLRFMDNRMNAALYQKSCPNCINDGFLPRPNGRIDLQPGGEAHFLVTGTKIDTEEDPWMHCLVQFPTIEVTPAPGDTPVSLPFEAKVCAAVDISAWREGGYDSDPMNSKWSIAHHPDIGPPTKPIPPDCNKPELRAFGQPHMIDSKGQLAFGLSLPSSEFTTPHIVPLHVWVDNAGDTPSTLVTCGGLDAFKMWGYELYDAYGHRVLRKREVKLKEECGTKDHGNPELDLNVCSLITVPAHTCTSEFSYNLNAEYDLPQGEYTVHALDHPQHVDDLCNQKETPFHATPGVDLTFEVLQP